MDLGLEWSEVDPAWHDAMNRIKAGHSEGQKKEMEQTKRKAKAG